MVGLRATASEGRSSPRCQTRPVDELERYWPRRLTARPDLRHRLRRAYDAPQRRYHDTRHLTEVLGRLELLLSQPEAATVDREAVLLAAWFHDAVYDAGPDDEERSAALAEELLTGADLPAPLVAEVARLVRVTADHRPAPGDLAGRVLCDADLAILGADPARYAKYARDVRQEYAHLDDEAFRAGRAQVLRALLDGPMFHTRLARERWEDAARANVTRELRALA